jgi:hypothetical protein
MKLEELNKLYNESETCDKAIFSEMRSNILLIAGDHYSKTGSSFFDRLRTNKDVSPEQKIRLTKNHIQKIVKLYSNNIVSYSPGVAINPKNKAELSDRKVAEMHSSVWHDGKTRKGYEDEMPDWADTFVGVGEIAHKFYFDPKGGELKGYAPSADNPEEADMTSPIMSGSVEVEEIYGFNLLRAPEAKTLDKSPYLIHRKMVKVDDLKAQYPDKSEKIKAGEDKTFLVFDQNGQYKKADSDEVLVKEFFFRPCAKYPNGYYWICTDSTELEDGELPLDENNKPVFPIITELFEKIQTTPRGRSIVKQLRPFQAEINRCGSKIAEHQVTLGDDKLILQNGSKVSAGASQPGIRVMTVTGQEPTVLPGRTGDQYLPYLESQISEMYQVAMVDEDSQVSGNNEQDVFAALFKAASKKKVFQRYIRKFERYLKKFVYMYLKFSKMYLDEDAIILAVGSKERINIAEFKKSDDLLVQIEIESQADDIESRMGQQLVMNQLLQYIGSNENMGREDIGKIIKNMPMANLNEMFDDLTIDYENATNDMLQLERGEYPQPKQFESHDYIIKKVNNRMKQADFQFLHEHVKMLYDKYLNEHIQMLDQAKKEAEMAASGLIPTSGPLVAVEFYTQYDPADPSKTRRARLPNDSINWLMEKLESQGVVQDQIEEISPEMQARLGAMQGEGEMNGTNNGASDGTTNYGATSAGNPTGVY